MKIFILFIAMVSIPVFAAPGEVTLSKACSAKLEAEALKAETAFLTAAGETIASKLEASVGLSYWPKRDDVNIGVRVTDEADGRYVRYGAKVLKADARQCQNITLVRRTEAACRYSRHEGPESLTEIKGITYQEGRAIKPDSRLSQLEETQIRTLLAQNGEPGATVAELIQGTDDGELSTATVTLPDGKILEYFGAYGGDNPYGLFFVAGTATVAGDNGDGSICIGYIK